MSILGGNMDLLGPICTF